MQAAALGAMRDMVAALQGVFAGIDRLDPSLGRVGVAGGLKDVKNLASDLATIALGLAGVEDHSTAVAELEAAFRRLDGCLAIVGQPLSAA